MKFTTTILFFTLSMFFLISCDDDIAKYHEFDSYNYSGNDNDGGKWKPVLLQDAEEFSIATPEDINTAVYKNEINEIKELQAALKAEQQALINYWGNNTAIRWNEIARELAAKYFLPPAPKEDGTYPAPSASNPGVYPFFPFSHPPYSCRMFAYLSAAQYDALISCWHYKYKFNRPSPSKTATDIQLLLPDAGLPSYPSEDAVISSVSKAILSAMFPLEKNYISERAEEVNNTRLWAGMNTKSDIIAGDSLGLKIATKFLQRAAKDGMSKAQTPKAVSDSIKASAIARFGWSWKNLEKPERPVGITPLFGSVTPWFIPHVEAVRPGPPPAIGSVEFNTAVDELKDLEKNITKEQRKIAYFWGDGPSTYTPPGHWNRIAAGHIIESKMNPLRTARVFAYMNMSIMDAGISCWDTKYFYHYPRPSQADSSIKVLLGIPNFPSFTSGHSTFSSAGATTLSFFFPQHAALFEKYAIEASESRIYARIHFRFDCETGVAVGKKIGKYAIDIASKDGAK